MARTRLLIGTLLALTGCGSGPETEPDSGIGPDAGADGDADADGDGDGDGDADADSDGDTDGDSDLDPACPFDRIPLPLDVVTEGDTSPSDNHVELGCQLTEQRDDIYAIDVPGEGVVTVKVFPGSPDGNPAAIWQAAVGLRTDCDDLETELACESAWTGSFAQAMGCTHEPGSISAVVDGQSDIPGDPQHGPYRVVASFEQCDAGEECIDAIGCVVHLEGGETCDDAVALPLDTPVGGDLTDARDDYDPPCTEDGGLGDVVYEVPVGAPGFLSLDIDYVGFATSVSARACADSQPLCDPCRPNEAFGGCVTPTANTLIVDGTGPYGLRASFTACAVDETCVDYLGCTLDLQGGDTCDDAIALPLGKWVTSDTREATDDFGSPFCGSGGGGGDVVYSISVPETGALQVDVVADLLMGSAALQTSCGDDSTRIACAEGGSNFAPIGDWAPITCVEAGDHWLVVDGADFQGGGADGVISVKASFEPCANGKVCVPGAGCATPLPGGESCDDAVLLPLDTTVAGDTSDAEDDLPNGCGPDGRDLVYQVTVPAAGALDVMVRSESIDLMAFSSVEAACGEQVGCVGPWGARCVAAGDDWIVIDGGFAEFTLHASFEECSADQTCIDYLGCVDIGGAGD